MVHFFLCSVYLTVFLCSSFFSLLHIDFIHCFATLACFGVLPLFLPLDHFGILAVIRTSNSLVFKALMVSSRFVTLHSGQKGDQEI